ncbi:hypothetical protein ACFWBF_18180 [Streptomyces sp. NPDC060028]|uniref:hypothetical protein n=1 Tax=Streptomyces sp. NPDC060028 TaxID=3347041 RepID=UPI0036771B1C
MQVSHEAIYLALYDPRRRAAIDRALTQRLRTGRPVRQPKGARSRPGAESSDRISYARVCSKGRDLAGQVRALKEAECARIYVEQIGTREKFRPATTPPSATCARPTPSPSPCSTGSAATWSS